MKKFLMFASIVGLYASISQAAGALVVESPILGYGTPATIAISSTTMTKVPTTQTSGRLGVFIDNPATNAQRIVGFFGDCSSTSIATTVRPIEIAPGNNSTYIPLREDVCLWLFSLDTTSLTANVNVQEVKQ